MKQRSHGTHPTTRPLRFQQLEARCLLAVATFEFSGDIDFRSPPVPSFVQVGSQIQGRFSYELDAEDFSQDPAFGLYPVDVFTYVVEEQQAECANMNIEALNGYAVIFGNCALSEVGGWFQVELMGEFLADTGPPADYFDNVEGWFFHETLIDCDLNVEKWCKRGFSGRINTVNRVDAHTEVVSFTHETLDTVRVDYDITNGDADPFQLTFSADGEELAFTIEVSPAAISDNPLVALLGDATGESSRALSEGSHSLLITLNDEFRSRILDTEEELLTVSADSGSDAVPFVSEILEDVILAWGFDAPYSLINVFGKQFGNPFPGTTTAAAIVDTAYQEAVLERVRMQLDASGIQGIRVMQGEPSEDDTVVYFVPTEGRLAGLALTGVDRFNERHNDEVLVWVKGFPFSCPDTCARTPHPDASTVLHEVGHALGLRHVDPPGDLPIMDYDLALSGIEVYTNGVFQIKEPPNGDANDLSVITHNPYYHIKRYVDRVPHEELVAQGVLPGRWDLPGSIFEPLEWEFSFKVSDIPILYNVQLSVGDIQSKTSQIIASFEQIIPQDLSEIQFSLRDAEKIQLIASSNPTGPVDIALSTGNPWSAPLGITLQEGQSDVLLQQVADNELGYTTVATGTITAVRPTTFSCDLTDDGLIDAADIGLLYSAWSSVGTDNADLNDDGIVDAADAAICFAEWTGDDATEHEFIDITAVPLVDAAFAQFSRTSSEEATPASQRSKLFEHWIAGDERHMMA